MLWKISLYSSFRLPSILRETCLVCQVPTRHVTVKSYCFRSCISYYFSFPGWYCSHRLEFLDETEIVKQTKESEKNKHRSQSQAMQFSPLLQSHCYLKFIYELRLNRRKFSFLKDFPNASSLKPEFWFNNVNDFEIESKNHRNSSYLELQDGIPCLRSMFIVTYC